MTPISNLLKLAHCMPNQDYALYSALDLLKNDYKLLTDEEQIQALAIVIANNHAVDLLHSCFLQDLFFEDLDLNKDVVIFKKAILKNINDNNKGHELIRWYSYALTRAERETAVKNAKKNKKSSSLFFFSFHHFHHKGRHFLTEEELITVFEDGLQDGHAYYFLSEDCKEYLTQEQTEKAMKMLKKQKDDTKAV